MRFKSIRTRLIVTISTLMLVLLLMLQATNIFFIQNAFSHLVPSIMESNLQSAHMQIQVKIRENFAALEAVARMPAIQDVSKPLRIRAKGLDEFITRNADKGYKACTLTDLDGKAVLSTGFEINVAEDDYFKEAIQGNKVVSDPLISRATGDLLTVYAVPYYDKRGELAGVITLDVDALQLSKDFNVRGMGETGMVFAIAQSGKMVVSENIESVNQQAIDFETAENDPNMQGLLASAKKMIAGETGNGEHTFFGKRELIYYMPVDGTHWSIAVTQAKAEAFGTVNSITFNGVVVLILAVIISVVAGMVVSRSISRPLIQLADVAGRLAVGDIEVEVKIDTQDETSILAKSFQEMTQGIRQQADAIARIAQGDYTVTLPVRSQEDVMNKAINGMVDNNHELAGDIRQAAEQVATGASQIASGAQSLAQGSAEQAATIEEFSAAITEVHSQAIANTDLAMETVSDVEKVGQLMDESIALMTEMTGAMHEIETSSQEIASVIKVIDDIAFQTNILALNAAVEAARAGEHGKGFAVVADEVRNLAGKSAEAAQETASLIEASVRNVARGVDIAAKTSAELSQVGAIASSNAKAMVKVSESSKQQGASIEAVNLSVAQVSHVVQANSATAQQSAASAEELNAQSVMLNRIVERFKLREDATTPLSVQYDGTGEDASGHQTQQCLEAANNEPLHRTNPGDIIF